MRKTLAVVLVTGLVATVAWAQTTVKADQGKPGTQGPWPVTVSGTSGSASDGGFTGYTLTQPCARIVQTNDAGYSTTPSRVPASGPAAGRIWIRICNTVLNASSAVCICSTEQCPASVAANVQGDALATADCVTYNMTTQDAGVPCCVCNGAGLFLPSTECVP